MKSVILKCDLDESSVVEPRPYLVTFGRRWLCLAGMLSEVCWLQALLCTTVYSFLFFIQDTRRRQLAEAAEKRQKEVSYTRLPAAINIEEYPVHLTKTNLF